MFVMFSLLSVSGTILEARKNGVWFRLLSTPVSRAQVIGGYMLSFFLIGWIQFGILMLLSKWLFDVQWGNLLGLIVLVSALLLAVVGLGMFIAGFVKTTEQQSAIGSIVIVSTCMLGGVYWPLDIVSDTMRRIAEFVPQFWAMQGFTELVARGGGVGDILSSVAVLLGFALVFLVAGISRVRYE
jgi:ABC-2 type transport system permease protein